MKQIALSLIILVAFTSPSKAQDCEQKWQQYLQENTVGTTETYQTVSITKRPMRESRNVVDEYRTVSSQTAEALIWDIVARNQNGTQREGLEKVEKVKFVTDCQRGDREAHTIIERGERVITTDAGEFRCDYRLYQQDEFTTVARYWVNLNGYDILVKEETISKHISIEAKITREIKARQKAG